MALYEPRVWATVFVPTAGLARDRQLQQSSDDVFRFDVRPHNIRLSSNNHNEADECEITFSYDEMGIDPRFARSAEVYIYVQDAQAFGSFTPAQDNLRFVGIVRDIEREFDEGRGKLLSLKAQDYTCLFLEAKNFPPSGVPLFTDTLATAWARICDHTGYWDLDTRELQSTVTNLRDRIDFQGDIDQSRTLGSAVPSRIAKLGKVQLGGAADAWAVWQACVNSLGLISFIRGDRCIVTTATDFYTASDPPRFLWGQNILKLTESRQLGHLSAKNVCARSYDPLSGKTLESLFPSPELAQKKKRLGANPPKPSKHGSKPRGQVVHTQDYECFDLPFAVADQKTLDDIAQRIWEERTRQELRGSLTTAEMFAATVYGSQNAFDLLTLQAGDQIAVEVDRDALDAIQSLPSAAQRARALLAKGFSADTAKFIANNLDSIDKLPSQFLVHSVETEIQSAGAEGGCSYSMTIEFLNRIDITAGGTNPLGAGSATNQADGSDQTPVQDQKTAPRVPKSKLPK